MEEKWASSWLYIVARGVKDGRKKAGRREENNGKETSHLAQELN
jgi:hypothetical protein